MRGVFGLLPAALWMGAVVHSALPAAAEDGGTPYRQIVRERLVGVAEERFGYSHSVEQPEGPRIIGGTVAPAARYRFMVSLLDSRFSNNRQAHFCGGTLFAAQWVLTAAHCVDFLPSPSALSILTGTANLGAGGTRRTVSKIIIHTGWTPSTSNNDIALVKLTAPATGVPRVRLLATSNENTLAGSGKPARTIGWGDIDPSDAQKFPAKLRHVLIAILSRSQCNAANSYDGFLTARMICAGVFSGGKDRCQGDSGGPLLVARSDGTFDVQAGIVSWGQGCAQPNRPGVYTRLAVYRNWIASKVASN